MGATTTIKTDQCGEIILPLQASLTLLYMCLFTKIKHTYTPVDSYRQFKPFNPAAANILEHYGRKLLHECM